MSRVLMGRCGPLVVTSKHCTANVCSRYGLYCHCLRLLKFLCLGVCSMIAVNFAQISCWEGNASMRYRLTSFFSLCLCYAVIWRGRLASDKVSTVPRADCVESLTYDHGNTQELSRNKHMSLMLWKSNRDSIFSWNHLSLVLLT